MNKRLEDTHFFLYHDNDVRKVRNKLEKAWVDYIETGRCSTEFVRPVIREAWKRCREMGIDCRLEKAPGNSDLSIENEVEGYDLLSIASPYVKSLGELLHEYLCVAVLSNDKGQILLTDGDPRMNTEISKRNLQKGAIWNESNTGNNGIGTCIALGRPIQIVSSEHFCYGWHDYICTASPIRHPITSKIIGALQISGSIREATLKDSYDLILNTVRKIELALYKEAYSQECLLKEETLCLLSSVSAEGIILIDKGGKVRFVNRRAKNVLESLGALRRNISPDFLFQKLTTRTSRGSKKVFEDSIDIGDQDIPVLVQPVIHQEIQLGYMVRIKDKDTYTPKRGYNKRITNRDTHIIDLVGQSPSFLKALSKAKRASNFDSTVLLEGETGTGKEVFAHLIHQLSSRSTGPFIPINCAAIPSDLLASELFGYEEGSFTGARRGGMAGKFELADGGTVFLDEISEISGDVQVYLLRFLQEHEFFRIGGKSSIHVDLRIIAASNKSLVDRVKSGHFRDDLYYRLNVISISLPSLRERKDDILLLADNYLEKIARRAGMAKKRLSAEALNVLENYSWPGNIRELENVLENAFIMGDSNVISPTDLPDYIHKVCEDEDIEDKPKLDESRLENTPILQVLKENGYNITQTARNMGISRSTIYRMLKRQGVFLKKHLSHNERQM